MTCEHEPRRKTELIRAIMTVDCAKCGHLYGKVPLSGASVGYGSVVMRDLGVDPTQFENVYLHDPPFEHNLANRLMLSAVDPIELIEGRTKFEVKVIEQPNGKTEWLV